MTTYGGHGCDGVSVFGWEGGGGGGGFWLIIMMMIMKMIKIK